MGTKQPKQPKPDEILPEAAEEVVPLTDGELTLLCELKTRFVAGELLTDKEKDIIGELSMRPGASNLGIGCVRCGKITYVAAKAKVPACRFCETEPLNIEETDEFAALMTRSIAFRQLEPEHARRLGSLRPAAEKAGLKMKQQTCAKCKRVFVAIEGGSIAGCLHCAGKVK
jgi:hypothetical protein